MLPIQECEITPQQEKLWSDTRVSLMWHCPAFTHILYTMMDRAGTKHIARFTKEIPIAATDGELLLLNPDTFFKYALGERTFIVAHEISHCMFNHLVLAHKWNQSGKVRYADGSELPYNHTLMNVAMDLVINDMLINCKDNAGKPLFAFPKEGMHDTSLATGNDSVVDAYKKVFQEAKKNGGKSGAKGSHFDQHLAPGQGSGKNATQATQDRSQTAWDTAISAAANAAKAQGKLPAGLQRLIDEILNPQVNWAEHIQALFARKVGSGSFDWRRPDRRLIVRDIYAPGRSGFGAGAVVVGIDTSGSIGPKELQMFFAEMAGILEDVRPKRLIVMWCDAAIGRVDELEEAGDLRSLMAKGAPGGGGTSFIPVFEEIERMDLMPDALVYLTDGMGSFPAEAPRYPVIWGNIYPASKYPFGDVVEVPKQAA